MTSTWRSGNRKVVFRESVQSSGVFTPPVAIGSRYESTIFFEWPTVESTADQDILAGRVSRFASVEDMLASLKRSD